MIEKYDFTKSPSAAETIKEIFVVNICEAGGVESGLPRNEGGKDILGAGDVTAVYDEALIKNTALPVFVGIPHAGELIPKEILPRIRNIQGFIAGLDCGTAMIFAPRRGDERYVAARDRISRLVADANRGPRQFEQGGVGIGGVTWKTDLQEHPIYFEGQEPTDAEAAKFVDEFYTPYYKAMNALAASLYERMGYRELLFLDAHSFPGDVDFPRYGIEAGEPKPLFVIGTGGGASASVEITRAFREALIKHSPVKEEFPELYENISEIVAVNSPFQGVRNVRYWGHPEGIVPDKETDSSGQPRKMPYKIHAIQLEINMSTFFKNGKYNLRHTELLRQTVQQVIKELGSKLAESQE